MMKAATILLLMFTLARLEVFPVRITWDMGTEPDLAGYEIVYKLPQGVWKHFGDYNGLPVKNGRTGKRLLVPVTGLEYHVAIVSYDHAGNRSAPSAQVVAINTADRTAHVIAPTPAVNVCPKTPLSQP